MRQNAELRRIKTQLDAARSRYFDLYDRAPAGYCALDANGLILEANLTLAGMLHVQRDALINQALTHFVAAEDLENFERHSRVLFASGAPQCCEIRLCQQDRTSFWALLKGTLAEAADGQKTCRVVISDLTAQKQAEQERFELAARLQQLQKSESLGRLAGAVAHHFNNQLQTVMGNLKIAQDDLIQGRPINGNINEAMKAACKAAEISRLMLTYLGQNVGVQVPVDLSTLCWRSLPVLKAALPAHVSLDADLPTPGPIVKANTHQMQQVVFNLLTNAWEAAGPFQCAIHLRVMTAEPASCPLTHRVPAEWQPDPNPHACLEVRDTGCGIQPQDLDNLFDPFFSTKMTGRGLGLSAVLGIVRVHGGGICLKGEPGKGSVFKIFLPLSETQTMLST